MVTIESRARREAQAWANNIGRLSDDHSIIAINLDVEKYRTGRDNFYKSAKMMAPVFQRNTDAYM
ncbi:hypothetical protein A7317_06630 [Pseudomonas fluorescens]|nr:hypothetical protein A7317_06630 [Pseudomonas fluorescens]AOE72507.1 hypothetical protein A7319_06645 [Pseudomonas fluorescens]